LFVWTLFAASLGVAVPAAAIAPAFIIAGGRMMSALVHIPWDRTCFTFPAFLTLVTIPLT